jgi:hypothetical protein
MYDRRDLDLGEGAMQRYFVSVIEGAENACLATVGWNGVTAEGRYTVLHAEIGTAAQCRMAPSSGGCRVSRRTTPI